MNSLTKIIVLSLFLLLATGLATLALKDNGQISMVWQGFIIETSLTFAVTVIAVGFISIYVLLRLLINLWQFPLYWRNRRQLKRYNKAESSMAKGLIALEYGDWQMAEKQLIKTAKQSESGLIHYLNAAKMAHNQGAIQRQNQYLNEARKRFPEDYVTIGLVESRLLLENDSQTAEVILAELHQQNPTNKAVLADYSQLLVKQQQWALLEMVLPKVKKQKALDKSAILEIEKTLMAGKVAKAENAEALQIIWQALSAKQQLTPAILAEFVEQKVGWGQEKGLANLIAKSLAKQWDDRLVYQFGRLVGGEEPSPVERLQWAQKWLTQQPNNAVLLLTLGRLACSAQLWGQAKNYFQQSLTLQPELETYHALAQCYEAEGLESQAALTYKEAILQLEKKH